MSINGNWLRVTPAELARAKDDLDWALDLARSAEDNEEWRVCGTDKARQAFGFLLERRGFDLPIVYGAEPFVDTPDVDTDDDLDDEDLDDLDSAWGYGHPRYLTPNQVATAADALANLTEDDLTRGVDQAELTRADIYPKIWDQPDQLGWVSHHLPYVREFFTAAAKDGHAVICWFN
ncbi:YfbM family protein [Plantactinospora endophytica]|uniref:DUF1877 family protein n=1 Tax=Plantactinospora endophytica TaxID=673535 RepID=A0ABQ4E9H8_9ACTN|nr:YfbM family protein [Plantactinospora endophytica]GIG90932.1 hypothetical protein Pen02_58680 [Plantactinospora endophytica]